MKNISWDNIDNLKDSEITYILFMEGRDVDTISRIRNKDRNSIERDILECKIKYRATEGSNSPRDILSRLMKCSKDERLIHIKTIGNSDLKAIEKYMIRNLFDCTRDECMFYVWLLGEIKSKDAVQGLITYLKCTDGNIKRMCCSALGKIGDLKSEDSLIGCLGDSKLQVREYAIKALGKLKSEKALPILLNIMNDSSQKEYIIRASKTAINEIQDKGDKIE